MDVETTDEGHILLIKHLKQVLLNAEGYEFHDFKNTAFAFPKKELESTFNKLAKNVRDGIYDN